MCRLANAVEGLSCLTAGYSRKTVATDKIHVCTVQNQRKPPLHSIVNLKDIKDEAFYVRADV